MDRRSALAYGSAADRSPFIWPVEAGIASGFGPRGETHPDGIAIAAAVGTPVRAARGGRVLYSDELRGYGNLLIVAHDDGYATVYAHNRENRTHTGEADRQGQRSAAVGGPGKNPGADL